MTKLTSAQMAENAALLVERNGTPDKMTALPHPAADQPEAYAVQQLVQEQLAKHGKAYGWKIGATNKAAQDMVGSPHPFIGKMFEHTRGKSGDDVAFGDLGSAIIEPEFAFELGKDMPARDGAYSADDAKQAIARVILSFEVVSSRFEAGLGAGVLNLIMDNGVHHGWLEGPSSADWVDMDLEAVAVTLEQNGEVVAEGSGAAVENGPIGMVAWLANQGVGLKAGEIVTTGTTVKPPLGAAGDRFLVKFGDLGEVGFGLV